VKTFKLGIFFTNIETDYNKAAPSAWIRIMQMIEYYKKLGVEVSINNYFKTYDAAIVYRKAKRKYYWMLRFAKLISKQVYFDTCIHLFEKHSEIDSKRLKYAFKIAKYADGFICASNQITRLSKPYCKSVFTFEDSINLNHFNNTKKNVNFERPVFGWSGVAAKAYFLNDYKEIVGGKINLITQEEIIDEDIHFNYNFFKWTYESFPSEILKCDIAFLPRKYQDNYNSGHSSFKALVFAVCGLPIIANKVPSYVDLSKYYSGIVFLEDYENSVQKCIEELKTRNLDTTKVRHYYSCENQANLVINYLKEQSGKF
jgi:hypothetical protein